MKTTTIQGGQTSVTEQSNSIYTYGSNNYRLCVGLIKETDIYGNIKQTFYEYDSSIGCLSEKAIEDDNGDFYQIETYSDYVLSGGSYHPQTITKTQFHPDDDEEFIQETQITYNNRGQKTSVVENAQSSALALTTYYSYDNNDNLVDEYSQGAGVQTLHKKYAYSNPIQKVSHTYTSPASTNIYYAYDYWGNLLTETDSTNSSFPLITSHTYDGWGNLLTTTSPEGITKTLTRGWGQNATMKYFVVEEQTGAPWLKTWYDAKGREVRTESVGEDHVSVTSSNTFNNKGQVILKGSSSGILILRDQYTYDALGRVETETLSSGKTTTYSYGDRATTTVVNGHTYVKTYDAWGNVITSTDPVSSVTFKYASNGKPVSATVGNNVVSMSYDEVGNRISLDDPDAGQNTYEYDALGRVTQKIDGNGRVSTYTYDVYGRLVCEQMGNQYYGNTINYTYGTQGNAAMRLVRKEMTNRIQKYEYDGFGRVVKETRLQPDEDSLTVEYTYNGNGLLGSVVYPGNVQVNYNYDDVGNKTQTFCNGVSAWKLQSFDGRIQESHICGDTIRHREVHNAKGYLSYLTTYRFDTRLDTIGFEFDEPTGNLIHRGRYSNLPFMNENFQYDAIDRLVNAKHIGTISYSSNGNISSMQNLGSYYYSDYDHPTSNHAVIRIGNQYDAHNYTTLDTCYQSIDYNSFNKFTFIDQYPGNRGYCMRVQYGPDKERWTSQLEEDDVVRRSILYAGDYERVTEQGITRHYYYLGNGVMMIRKNGIADKLYYACTDNIGSICRIYDSNGTNVFYANYNAWGKQTVSKNTIAFHRGFTGHEMMPDFQLINMNGRLYDPLIGRFLSPDNYVQLPDFSQNFNRYSYCLNNPLKYTDPSGEVFGIDDCIAALIGGTINLVTNLIEGNVTSFWHGFTLFSAGALSGWGSLYCPLLAVPLLSGGNSIINQGFTYGLNNISWDQVVGSTAMGSAMFITGGVLGSFASIPISSITEKIASPVLREIVNQGIVNSTIGFITRTGLAYVNGESFEDALKLGFHDFLTGLALGTINGTAKGIQYARNNKISPWTGERINNHHSHPIFIGGDEHQKLTPMSESRHRQLHTDLNDYLREQINEQGYHMRPQRGNDRIIIKNNFSDEARFNAIKGFYDQHPIKYWDARYDFYRNTNTSWKPFNFGR